MSGWQMFGINYLYGLLVYFTIIRTLDKKDIKFLIKGVTWMCVLAAIWLALQLCGYDLRGITNIGDVSRISTNSFFWQASAMGIYFAQSLPLITVLTPVSFLFFAPLINSECSGAIIGAGVAWLFFLWFRKRLFFWILLIPLILGGIYYTWTKEAYVGLQIRLPMWKLVVQDIMRKPLGHGLDTFEKPLKGQWAFYRHSESGEYLRARIAERKVEFQVPDKERLTRLFKTSTDLLHMKNPHNEYLWLGYEVGLIALGILGFLYYFTWVRFWISFKDPVTCGLMASLIAIAIISILQFPLHISRVGHMIPVIFGLFYINTEEENEIL